MCFVTGAGYHVIGYATTDLLVIANWPVTSHADMVSITQRVPMGCAWGRLTSSGMVSDPEAAIEPSMLPGRANKRKYMI
eukprot:scaffold267598_cov25-Prasinocladus_malaysianus.AAC.1